MSVEKNILKILQESKEIRLHDLTELVAHPDKTAIKLKSQSITQYVVGLAITGSFKGFDVIQEV